MIFILPTKIRETFSSIIKFRFGKVFCVCVVSDFYFKFTMALQSGSPARLKSDEERTWYKVVQQALANV